MAASAAKKPAWAPDPELESGRAEPEAAAAALPSAEGKFPDEPAAEQAAFALVMLLP